MRLITGLILLLAVLAGTGCQAGEQPAGQEDMMAAAMEAINEIRDAYMAAENSGDAAGVAALFTENGVLMPPNEPIVSSRTAIEARLQKQYSMMAIELSLTPQETRVGGDIAYEAGSNTVQMTPKAGGDPIGQIGKHVVTLAKQADGSWKITSLIYNGDAPPTPTAAGQ